MIRIQIDYWRMVGTQKLYMCVYPVYVENHRERIICGQGWGDWVN